MSEQPSVVCVMLTAARPAMARQAVECFRAQTYEKKRLFVLDTGSEAAGIVDADSVYCERYPGMSRSIGEMRNWANSYAGDECLAGDIIIHWDDDDWSHPRRIAEQVALLQASGSDVVGYREMLFWADGMSGTPPESGRDNLGRHFGEAWLYSNPNSGYALGTSLCYWRSTWERKPFPDTSRGEDLQFCMGLKIAGCQSFWPYTTPESVAAASPDTLPRMIARIHGGNTSTAYAPKKLVLPEWRRAPEWDQHCRSVFA